MSYRHGALALSGIPVLQQREVAEWVAVPAVSTTRRFLSILVSVRFAGFLLMCKYVARLPP